MRDVSRCKNCNREIVEVETAEGMRWFHQLEGYVEMWCQLKYAEPMDADVVKGQEPLPGLEVEVENMDVVFDQIRSDILKAESSDLVSQILKSYETYINTPRPTETPEMQKWFRDEVEKMGIPENSEPILGIVSKENWSEFMREMYDPDRRIVPTPEEGSPGTSHRKDSCWVCRNREK